jgi:hypothetical protein
MVTLPLPEPLLLELDARSRALPDLASAPSKF